MKNQELIKNFGPLLGNLNLNEMIELNDFDFNNIDYRQVDLMIAFGEFNGSSDYLIACLLLQ